MRRKKQKNRGLEIPGPKKLAVHLSPEGHLLGVGVRGDREGGSFVSAVRFRLDHDLEVGPSFAVEQDPGGFRLVPL